jgi:hypothetical protein
MPSSLQATGGHTPQSTSQLLQLSDASQTKSPQTAGGPQSAGQDSGDSEPLHWPSPQNGLAAITEPATMHSSNATSKLNPNLCALTTAASSFARSGTDRLPSAYPYFLSISSIDAEGQRASRAAQDYRSIHGTKGSA